MADLQRDLVEAERAAIAALTPELDAHMALCLRTFNLTGRVRAGLRSVAVELVPLSQRVAAVLIAHLSNHLHCSAMVAIRGYPAQACTLAASVYEAAFAIMAIASDDARAQKWAEHDDPNSSVFGIKQMTREGLRNVMRLKGQNPSESELNNLTDQRYLVYRQLCWPKHLNPIFLRVHGVTQEPGRVLVSNGPDWSEDAVRALWFGLEQASGLAASACAVFIEHHVPSESRSPLNAEVNEVIRAALILNRRAADRWGSENPFPDKWRV